MKIKSLFISTLFISTLVLCNASANANIMNSDNEENAVTPREISNTNSDIVIESDGFKFSPIMGAAYMGSDEGTDSSPALYAGQEMQSLEDEYTGTLTGSILVKMKSDDLTLSFDDAKILVIGNGFFIITFDENIDLLKKIKEIKALSTVEAAEIEVNTQEYLPL
ncbi:hypothetical protein HWV01_07825 [Moritella sp. 5]|uniref:hypothetical protein n=1 Tax=Moritella sp. 5 TaxID=2746231 RepID=UPI001BA8294A|nr:hypothetical protein [Moritella sp. 5]QUM80197.1 hypothetical protein HWV01_07825 [Moritella sp. 5]